MQTKRRKLTKSEWVILLVPALLLATWWINKPGAPIVRRNFSITFKSPMPVINYMSFSPDGGLLAVGEADYKQSPSTYSLRVWDVRSRQELWSAKAPAWQGWPYFSPDGSRIATLISNLNLIPDPEGGMANSYVQIYEARTGNPLMKLPVGKGGDHFYFLPDKQHMLIGGNPLRLWDLQTQSIKRTLARNAKRDFQVTNTISKDGRFVATATGKQSGKKWIDDLTKILDVASGRVLSVLPAANVKQLFFSDDSEYLNMVEASSTPIDKLVRWRWCKPRLIFKKTIGDIYRIRYLKKHQTAVCIERVPDSADKRVLNSKIKCLDLQSGVLKWSIARQVCHMS